MLSQTQKSNLQKLRKKSNSPQDRRFTESHVRYLIAVTARDLGIDLKTLSDVGEVPEIYDLKVGDDFEFATSCALADAYEEIINANRDAESYLACLGKILRSRLKMERVMEAQPLATMNQVGPRAILQYGVMGNKNLASYLVWRKYMFDVDNRAAQDNGYLYEAIIASAIGGISCLSLIHI